MADTIMSESDALISRSANSFREQRPVTTQIPLSRIKAAGIADFDTEVRAYAQAMVEHLKTVNVPAPQAHPLVKAAVKRQPVAIDKPDLFVLDYEIVDDTPVSPAVQLLRDTIRT